MMAQHGNYCISTSEQVVTLKASGAWNIETVRACFKELKESAEQIKDKNWSCLFELTNWELGPPGMWDEIKAFNFWAETNNQVFKAIVISNNIHQLFFEKTSEFCKNIQIRMFDNEIDAKLWLVSAFTTNK